LFDQQSFAVVQVPLTVILRNFLFSSTLLN
jgi:hypothetical protein